MDLEPVAPPVPARPHRCLAGCHAGASSRGQAAPRPAAPAKGSMIDMEDQKISEEATRLAADPAFAQNFEDVPGEPPLRRVRYCVAGMWGCRAGCSADLSGQGHHHCAKWGLQIGHSRKQPVLTRPLPRCLRAGPESRHRAGLVTAQSRWH